LLRCSTTKYSLGMQQQTDRWIDRQRDRKIDRQTDR
jgi:hypothetical protein